MFGSYIHRDVEIGMLTIELVSGGRFSKCVRVGALGYGVSEVCSRIDPIARCRFTHTRLSPVRRVSKGSANGGRQSGEAMVGLRKTARERARGLEGGEGKEREREKKRRPLRITVFVE